MDIRHPSAIVRDALWTAAPPRFHHDHRGEPDVVLHYLSTDEDWSSAERMVDRVSVTGLIPGVDISSYRRGYAIGCMSVVDVSQTAETVWRSVTTALNGEALIPIEAVRLLAAPHFHSTPNPLSSEEAAFLQRVADGESITEIAKASFVGERTARRTLQNICLKLGVSSRSEAIKEAAKRALIS